MTANHTAPAFPGADGDSEVETGDDMGGSVLPGSGIRVAVASQQTLVTESVATALATYGFDVWTVPTPVRSGLRLPPGAEGVREVGLMMYDIDAAPQRRVVMAVLRLARMQWLLLTASPRGPLWGAVYEAGVTAILPSTTQRDDVVAALRLLAAGGAPEEGDREELLRQWRTSRTERDRVMGRIASLTPRERSVLHLLYLGESVRSIARVSGVSETTVRSQVRSVLRKLEVNSQLSAVAAWAAVREELEPFPEDLPDLPKPRREL